MSKDKENDEISKISENQGDEEDEEANTSQNASFLPVTIEDCGSVADSYDAQTSFTSHVVIQPVEMLRFSSGTSEARSKVSYILSGTSEARSNVFFGTTAGSSTTEGSHRASARYRPKGG
jgi:hypothetical protein